MPTDQALVGKLAQLGNLYYVCTPTPLQYALARVLLRDPSYYDRLRTDFARKRQLITSALESTGSRHLPFEVELLRLGSHTGAV
jgi:aminotransferase